MIFMEEGAKSAFGAKAVDDPHGFQDSPLDSPARTPGTRTPVLVRKQSDAPLPARIDTAALLVTVETSVGDQKMTIAEAIKTRPPAAYMDAFKDTMPLPAPRLHTAPAGARRPIAQPTPAMPTKQPTVKVVPTARFAGGASYLPGPPKPKLVPPDFDSADGQKTKPPVVLPLGLKFLYPPQPGSYSARERQPPAPHPNWIAAANVHLSPPATARADVGRKGRVFDRRKQQYPFGVLLERSLVERQKQQQSQPAASPPNDSFRSSQPSRSRSPATARPAQSQAATAMALGAYGIATAAAPSACLYQGAAAESAAELADARLVATGSTAAATTTGGAAAQEGGGWPCADGGREGAAHGGGGCEHGGASASAAAATAATAATAAAAATATADCTRGCNPRARVEIYSSAAISPTAWDRACACAATRIAQPLCDKRRYRVLP